MTVTIMMREVFIALVRGMSEWLVKKEKDWEGKSLNDMVAMCYGGRYVILLNGVFGMYVGLMYNEAFAFPMNWFGGSRWYQYDDQFGTASPNFCLSDQASCQVAALAGAPRNARQAGPLLKAGLCAGGAGRRGDRGRSSFETAAS